ncbi:histidinol-phosphate transaminase [Microcoleus sp. FACHB-1515]|uniref:histidinol-phosphate transaminase n=1 Tax=Cyanophyceae TaxID=3028117 RepID=UPI00168791E6|nr:histidinol-phosphate transaminase [Microcoleus sp. FACHB-1515]MBD2091960.1 histidinol-phosphate transaminase [Microcoleus sp. FACHB-1515]
MLPFLRSDLAQLIAYTPHPGGKSGSPESIAIDTVPGALRDRLDTNECPYDLPNDLKQKLAWQFQHELEANRYPDGAHAALKAAIAQYVTESTQLEANAITAANISVSNGSDELIRSILIASCIGGNGAILVAQPTFSMYAITAKTLSVPVVTIDRSIQFEMDLTAAQRAIDATQNPPIRAVFVVHPNSPTANALTEREIDWLLSLPPEVLVVVDEAYFEFSQTSLVGSLRSNWVILRTFSKAFRLAAQRVGYAIAHPELIAALEKVRLPYNLPSFSQIAALVTLAQRHELLTVIPTILEERSRLLSALRTLPELQVWPSDANFLFVRRKDESSLEDVFHALKAQGTLVRSIANGLRITVGTPEENQRTIDRLTALL